MPITLGSNIASLLAQRRLGEHTDALSRLYERLSSGQRINRASDDAAGLAIADSLRTNTHLYTQALRNVNDGISVLAVADGALASLQGITERQRELATQAANGVYSSDQRRALDKEFRALTKEYNRVIESTEFNGISLLQDPTRSLSLQIGNQGSDSLTVELGSELARTVGTGTFRDMGTRATGGFPTGTATGDFDGDGRTDFVVANNVGNSASIIFGNGDGTFKAAVNYQSGIAGPESVNAIDVNNDSLLDLLMPGTNGFSVLLGNGNGSFKAAVTYTSASSPRTLSTADLNSDGYLDVVTADNAGFGMSVYMGQAGGTFAAGVSSSIGTQLPGVALGDVNGDGKIDALLTSQFNGVYLRTGNGDGSFGAYTLFSSTPAIGATDLRLSDLDADGDLDIATSSIQNDIVGILFNNGNGSFAPVVTTAVHVDPFGLELGDLNGDGFDDIAIGGNSGIQVLLNDGHGSFATPITRSAPRQYRPSLGDFNGDGVLDIASAESSANAARVFLADTTLSNLAPTYTLFTQAEARETMDYLVQQQQRISMERAQIGATQSRLEVNIRYLSTLAEVSKAAEARIRDADVAQDAAELVRRQILQQSTAAVLAQANQSPALALKLLQ